MTKYRLPWTRMQKRSEPEPAERPPLLLGPISNGEIFREQNERARQTTRLIMEKADEGARRLGIHRREFLASSMGMATSLWALNMASGCSGDDEGMRPDGGGPGQPPGNGMNDGGVGLDGSFGMNDGGGSFGDGGPGDAGGYFDVPTDPTDPEKVCEVMLDASKEFVFDIQTHHVHRANALYTDFLRNDTSRYRAVCGPQMIDTVKCFDRSEYIRLMFLESDTTVAVLSGLPAIDDANNPITNPEIAEARDIINMMADGTQRLINHHMVLPNQMGKNAESVKRQLGAMERTKDMYGTIGAWKCYPAWSPLNTVATPFDGYFLDDEVAGIPFITKGLELGVGTFCIHKGLPIPGFSSQFNDPQDIGRVAKRFPQAKFIVYHSGYGHQSVGWPPWTEGPYTNGSRAGTNSLITSLIENGIGQGSNVYAELGTTWQMISTSSNLNTAAHVVGKLLKHVGEDNVVWGTDSIWYGSPQSQIESFLQFQISESFQQQYGYPALTMERKRKILGLNAARAYGIDPVAMRCGIDKSEMASAKSMLDAEIGGRRWAFFQPEIKTRREFMSFHQRNGFRPG